MNHLPAITMQAKDEPAFFISRPVADTNIAKAIAEILRDTGCKTWLQDEDVSHASFMARMAKGFAEKNRIVALLSWTYQRSREKADGVRCLLQPVAHPQIAWLPYASSRHRPIFYQASDSSPISLANALARTLYQPTVAASFRIRPGRGRSGDLA